MKKAQALSLIFVLIGVVGCMWVVASMAVYLFVPTVVPESFEFSRGETLISGIICLIGPFTCLLAGGLVWWLGVRPGVARHAPTPTPPHAMQPVPLQPTAAPPVVSAPPPQPTSNQVAPTQTPTSVGPARTISTTPSHQLSIMNDYFAEMIELLMTYRSVEGAARKDLQYVLQAQSWQALYLLDAAHRGRVIQFLHNTRLLRGPYQINLHGLDLSGTDLRFADLRTASLTGAQLSGAVLTGALLDGANLSKATLDDADLRLAQLERTTLSEASLSRSKLHKASLRSASMHGANLHEANLWSADLTGAQVTSTQLQRASTLASAILPDGTTCEQRS